MLIIRDEELARELTQIAQREKRAVEDVLKSMVAKYPAESSGATLSNDKHAAVLRARLRVYARAREFWKANGDSTKAAMTDEEMDIAFGAFDEDGIPRLKSELHSSEPPPGSLAYASQVSQQGSFNSGRSDLARNSEEILDEHFAADISSRLRDEDGKEPHSH